MAGLVYSAPREPLHHRTAAPAAPTENRHSHRMERQPAMRRCSQHYRSAMELPDRLSEQPTCSSRCRRSCDNGGWHTCRAGVHSSTSAASYYRAAGTLTCSQCAGTAAVTSGTAWGGAPHSQTLANPGQKLAHGLKSGWHLLLDATPRHQSDTAFVLELFYVKKVLCTFLLRPGSCAARGKFRYSTATPLDTSLPDCLEQAYPESAAPHVPR